MHDLFKARMYLQADRCLLYIKYYFKSCVGIDYLIPWSFLLPYFQQIYSKDQDDSVKLFCLVYMYANLD